MKISVQDCINLINSVIEPLNSDLASHLRKGTYIAYSIAKEMGLTDNQVKHVFIVASIHDISVLLSKTHGCSLTDSEILQNYTLNSQKVEREIQTLTQLSNILQMGYGDANAAVIDDVVYFAYALEFYLRNQEKDYIAYTEDLIDGFFDAYPGCQQAIAEAVKRLVKKDIFWLRLETPRMYDSLQHVSPLRGDLITLKELEEICLILARIVDKHSCFTVVHCTSVGRVAGLIAELMKLPEEIQKKIRIAGYLHDIGKVHIPPEILNKEGPLTHRERALMKKHSFMTYEMLCDISSLSDVTSWAANHHERLDGSGYPFGLKEQDLDLPSRIMAVADMFTALVENRPYRNGMSTDDAMKILDDDVARGKVDGNIVRILEANADRVAASVGVM